MTGTSAHVYAADAELEHGWGASTPLDDTIHRRSVLALAESTARPSEAMGARSIRTDELVATHLGRPAGYWNAAVVTRPPDAAGWQRVGLALAELDAEPGSAGHVDLWSPFPTPDLRVDGWQLAGHPVAMWRPPGANEPPVPPDLRIERVTDEAGVHRWADAAVASYPLDADPSVIATTDLLDAEDVHLYTGSVEDRPVAVAAVVLTHGTNAVVFVAVRSDARGRGYGRAITGTATTARPELPAVLLASDDGRPVYERMGYLPLTRWTMWVRGRGG